MGMRAGPDHIFYLRIDSIFRSESLEKITGKRCFWQKLTVLVLKRQLSSRYFPEMVALTESCKVNP